ncbi:Phospholipase-like [Sesbania bispinosa]|nr:Phospholipase-like [Sesbania bispinosa]
MAPNGTVNPNCPNLSNPYHQCTQACSQKSNRTKPHTHTPNKRTSPGYGRSITDGQLGKKVNEERRTHSACPKASNPYHKCDQNCYTRSSDSGAPPPSNIDRQKKQGSKPQPPVLDSVSASKVGAIYVSDASSPMSQYSEKKKMEPASDEHNPSEPVSGQVPIPDVMPVNGKDQLKEGADHLANPKPKGTNQEDKIASHKIVPITYADDTGEGLTTSAGGSRNSSFAGIPLGIGNEDSDEGETESVISESRVPVGRYHVKESFASILLSILDKYGDIGASCHLESVAMRSYYIECVCFVVQELQSDSIMQLSKSKVNELLAILKDVESAKLRVAWLRNTLDEIAENIGLFNEHQDVEAAKANSDREKESLREQLESELEALAQKEQEVADMKTRIPEIRDRLSELELKSSQLDESMLSIKSKVDNLHSKSLIDELL